ncbi:MAG: DUF1294 domain-containing protein [Oscillospiraceae bacterium]|nr:DUF1294 domain-containing protein [Clostridiales bacterium]MDY2962472.1 DUF1294 domain-containing protein [Oscillospiraceae bacterium]MDD6078083.1 DUF1294 domain-containing protein [Clostridiales bacterium]MDD6107322.1 DUF1294 domain-containing protein [Clostridiales bacterium]MDD6935592.1 DUF1294 domain-containing protein [Clostridiales bacterium]
MTQYLLICLAAVNVAAFAAMGIDKAKAKAGAWRVPEATLFLLAVLGGSVGGILGMQLFRHKTKHKTFTVGFPAILVCQLALAAYILLKWKWNLL